MEKNIQACIDSLTKAAKKLNDELHAIKQREALLKKSEERYRAFFNDTCVGLAQVAEEGRFLEVNPSFCNILGYDRNELLCRTYSEIIHAEDRQADHALWQELLAGNTPSVLLERRYIRKDGSAIWVVANLSVTRSRAGEESGILVTIQNISERRMLQDSLSRIASNLAKEEIIALGGTWKWYIETGEVTASDEVFQLLGLHSDTKRISFEVFLSRIHPDDRDAVSHAFQMTVSGQKMHQIEYRLNLPDGSQRVVLASGEVYRRNSEGRPLSVIGLIQDITSRKQAELSLRESERRFRELFDNAVDGIFITDRNGVYIQVNKSACELLGYSSDELVGKNIADLVPEKDSARLAREKEHFLQNANNVQIEEWDLLHRNGKCVTVEVSARTLPDGRWMAIVRDVRERRRIQKKLGAYAAEIQDIYDNAPCGYHSVNRDSLIVQMNKTELDWLGYDAEEIIGRKKITDLLTDECKKRYLDCLSRLLYTGLVRDMEFELVRKDGTIFPVLMTASAMYDDKGRFVRTRTSVFDMTERSEANKKLRQAATVFEHTNDAILITNPDGQIVAVNNAFTRITGYMPEEVVGKNPRLMKSGHQNNEFYRSLWDSIEKTGTWQGEIWDRRKNGEAFPAWESITAVRDQSGRVTDYISIFSDITTIKETEKRLTDIAYHDALTGLPNRLLFNDRMNQTLVRAKRHQSRVALLLLDLDRFKLINDTLGHAAGDQLLQVIAARLQEATRQEDTIARLGGDEFAIVLGQLNQLEDAALLAQKIVAAVSQPVQIMNKTWTTSTSIGISIYPDDATDSETLAKCADMAMYGAKAKGRNVYEFYTREMTMIANRTLTIDHGLRNAIRLNELVLYYQPQIDLLKEKVTGVEALIRWNRPEHGQENPSAFIPVAEESDLISSVGDWILDTACEQLLRWRSAGYPPIRIAVNISVRQIRRPHFVEDMRHRLARLAPIDGFKLELEITETAFQTGMDIVDILKEMKPLGVKLAIDDFGTGYSSLSSLKYLPVEILKIDRSFIEAIPSDADDKAIASAIIAMGHVLGMRVIAEGIETREQLQFLVEQNCDEAQGFLFFRPLPPDECAHLLMSGNAVSVASAIERRHGRLC